MKRIKYKGVVDPGKIPSTKTNLEEDSLEPAYIKKLKKSERLKLKEV